MVAFTAQWTFDGAALAGEVDFGSAAASGERKLSPRERPLKLVLTSDPPGEDGDDSASAALASSAVSLPPLDSALFLREGGSAGGGAEARGSHTSDCSKIASSVGGSSVAK